MGVGLLLSPIMSSRVPPHDVNTSGIAASNALPKMDLIDSCIISFFRIWGKDTNIIDKFHTF